LLTYCQIAAENEKADIFIQLYNITQILIKLMSIEICIFDCLMQEIADEEELDIILTKKKLMSGFACCVSSIENPLGIKYPGKLLHFEIEEKPFFFII